MPKVGQTSPPFNARQTFFAEGVRKEVIMTMIEEVRTKIKCALDVIGHILLIISSLL